MRSRGNRPCQLFAHAAVVAQLVQGRASRLIVAVARRAKFLVAIIEMLLEFLRDFRFTFGIQVGGGQSPDDLVVPARHGHTSPVPAMRSMAAANARQVLRCSSRIRRPDGVSL